MSLVERFVELQGWTTSRKVVVVSGFLTGLSGVLSVVAVVGFASTDWVDLAFFDTMSLSFFVHAGLTTLVAWRVDRSGAEGRWTFHLLAIPYGLLLFVFLWGMGPLSNPYILTAPMAVTLVFMVFDQRQGLFAAGMLAVGTGVLLVLMVGDWFTYAPALQTDSLDRLTSPRVALVVWSGVFGLLGANIALAWVVVTASRRATDRLDAARRMLARYVPVEVAEDITSGLASDADGHHRRKLTVFFSDLVGFSDVAEELEPEDLALVVNEYFGEMTEIAHRHHGTVDELQGDALLILFGAPHATTDREHALNAVRMAAEMHEAMDRLNAKWRKSGITETLAVRMGINTGVVTVGTFGTPTRLKYAALGKHVNVAARLQALAEPGSTVISYATYLLVEDDVECRPLGPQQLKGITKPVEAFVLAQRSVQRSV